MSTTTADRSVRFVRWWARRYTAGLEPLTAAARRAEVESDLAEHEHSRRTAGWSERQVVRERLERTVAGLPADIAWRYDRLHHDTERPGLVSVLGWATTVGQFVLATYVFAFAAFLLGNTGLADHHVLGMPVLAGFDHYADASGASTAASIIVVLGLILVVSALARSISPIVSNVAALPIAMLATLFFWLGIWPLAALVAVGSVADLALRAHHSALR